MKILDSMIYELLKEKLHYKVESIECYFSDSHNRRMIDIEFNSPISYDEFVKWTKEVINEYDIAFHDDTGVLIDLTENLIKNLFKLAEQKTTFEYENLRPRRR
jgi:glutathionylspermidine synthase